MSAEGRSIALHGVGKSWGEATALHAIDVQIPAGSFTTLLGPSGCGKSTLLRLISGLETASEGKIMIDGQDVTHLSPDRRGLAMVFQNYALFPHLSVAENIVFGLRTRRTGAAERQQRLHDTAELLGLERLLNRKPSELSGGQQQRVALGRAIVARRPICLMDEPLSNLDAKLRQEMRVELRALQQQLGFTMVYVTHDQAEAMTMADQVVLLNAGRIEQIATPRTLYETPATRFAARFIGTPPMNVLPARAFEGAPGIPDINDSALLGLRPEDIRLDQTGLPTTITGVEYFGPDTLLTCALGADQIIVRVSGQGHFSPGTTAHLRFDPANLHHFQGVTGLRVSTQASS